MSSTYSIVGVPEGDADRVVSALRQATIRGKKVTIRRYVESSGGEGDRPRDRPRSHDRGSDRGPDRGPDRGRGDAPRSRQAGPAGKAVRRDRW